MNRAKRGASICCARSSVISVRFYLEDLNAALSAPHFLERGVDVGRKFFRGRSFFVFVLFFLLVSIGHASAASSARPDTLRAGICLAQPFAMRLPDGTYAGMAVDLWDLIARNLRLSVRYVEYPTMEALLSAVQKGEVDLAVSNLSVTYDRARNLSFSYPWYDSGLRIMINEDAPADVWGQLKKSGALRVYFWIFVVLAVLSLLWALLRRREADFPPQWRDALPMTFFDVFVAARSGRLDAKHLRGGFAYLFAIVWMLFGLVMIAYITSTFTSAMTTASLKFEINSLRDLPGKTVGVPKGSAESLYLQRRFIQTIPYDNMDEMLAALEKNQIDAIVTDAPVLEYWLHMHPRSKNEIVGGIFFTSKYAFAANQKYEKLMSEVSLEIVRLQETGEIRGIRDRYFGGAGVETSSPQNSSTWDGA